MVITDRLKLLALHMWQPSRQNLDVLASAKSGMSEGKKKEE
jgi:hypothetical protein